MSRLINLVWFLSIFFFCTSCAGPTFRSQRISAFNFAEVSTISIPEENSRTEAAKKESRLIQKNPYFVKRMHSEIAQNLNALGYRVGSRSEAQLSISFRTGLRREPTIDHEELRFKKGLAGSNFPDADPRARRFQERSLVIEAYEPRSGTIVWEANAEHLLPEFFESDQGLSKTVHALFANFPARR